MVKTLLNASNLCADPEGWGKGVRTLPLKNNKNSMFLSNTGLDPLKNHKSTKPDIWIPFPLIKKFDNKTSELGPGLRNPLAKLSGSAHVIRVRRMKKVYTLP